MEMEDQRGKKKGVVGKRKKTPKAARHADLVWGLE